MTDVLPQPRVGYVLRSYPRLSQTFVLNEILALEQLGLGIHIFAVTDPHEPCVQTQVADVKAPVHYLDVVQRQRWVINVVEHLCVALAAPRRYFQTLRYVLQHPELGGSYSGSSRYDCFRQAVHLARLLEREKRRTGRAITHLHAHFAHDPTVIALLTHMLTGISYSFTAHARDIYQVPPAALAERIQAASTVVTCCRANVDYLSTLVPDTAREKVQLVHHGVNLHGFQPAPREHKSVEPPLILSVSRLVEKKGYPDLLHACQRLKQSGYRFRCIIYGEGPLHDELIAMIEQLEVAHEVSVAGACTQRQLVPVYQQADIFALTPFVTQDGDRDGVPNVLIEAMACGLPVVSTTVGGIPDLVTHEQNGLLVEPRDVDAIAAAIAALLDDASRRQRLGIAARLTVVEQFDLRATTQQIADCFERVLRMPAQTEENGPVKGSVGRQGHGVAAQPYE